jgi:hypothetical protein
MAGNCKYLKSVNMNVSNSIKLISDFQNKNKKNQYSKNGSPVVRAKRFSESLTTSHLKSNRFY